MNYQRILGMKNYVKAILTVGVLSFIVALSVKSPLYSEIYKIYENPVGSHRLEVYRRFYMMTSPGGSGDVPGVVFLKNKRGDMIRKKNIEMVSLVDNPKWTANGVYVHFVLDWSFE